MWADYYEKYRGTPKFGMSEQDKLEAQTRLEGLKNAYLMNALSAKLRSAEKRKGAELGGQIGEGGVVTPAAPGTVSPKVAAEIEKNKAGAGLAKSTTDLNKTMVDALKGAGVGQTPTTPVPGAAIAPTNPPTQPKSASTDLMDFVQNLKNSTPKQATQNPKAVLTGIQGGKPTLAFPGADYDMALNKEAAQKDPQVMTSIGNMESAMSTWKQYVQQQKGGRIGGAVAKVQSLVGMAPIQQKWDGMVNQMAPAMASMETSSGRPAVQTIDDFKNALGHGVQTPEEAVGRFHNATDLMFNRLSGNHGVISSPEQKVQFFHKLLTASGYDPQSPEVASYYAKAGAHGYDTDKSVYVDQNGNTVF
jgi:hypothetical protein